MQFVKLYQDCLSRGRGETGVAQGYSCDTSGAGTHTRELTSVCGCVRPGFSRRGGIRCMVVTAVGSGIIPALPWAPVLPFVGSRYGDCDSTCRPLTQGGPSVRPADNRLREMCQPAIPFIVETTDRPFLERTYLRGWRTELVLLSSLDVSLLTSLPLSSRICTAWV